MVISNLFVVFTASQAFHVKNIITQYGFDNVLVISTNQIASEYFSDSYKVITIPSSYLGTISTLYKLKRILARLSKNSVNLFVPHFLNVSSQFVYFQLKSNSSLKHINVFPDGNLLFNQYLEKRWSKNNILRKIKSLLIFSKYKMIDGDICMCFEKDISLFSYMDKTRYSEKNIELHIIDMPQVKTNDNRNGLLILGHYSQDAIDSDILTDSIKDLISRFSLIYYKPHPRLNIDKDKFYSALSRVKDNITLVNDASSVETMVDKLEINTLFAVGSSSLITLKLQNPFLDVVYSGLEEYLGVHYDPLIRDNLLSLGVKELKYKGCLNHE